MLFVVSWSTATIQVQQHLPTRRHLLLDSDINFSLLSASCANETEFLAKAIYGPVRVENSIFYYDSSSPYYSTYFLYENENITTCAMELHIDETRCIQLGGIFYDNYTNSDFHRCLSNNGNVDMLFEFDLQYYPICAGASCNTYEVIAAVKETIAADLNDGLLGSQIRELCGLPEKQQLISASNTRSNFGKLVIIFVSFAILAGVIYVFRKSFSPVTSKKDEIPFLPNA